MVHKLVHPDTKIMNMDHHKSNIEYLFSIMDCFNLLRGFFFFIIFICKKSAFEKIKKYFKSNRRRFGASQVNLIIFFFIHYMHIINLELKDNFIKFDE